MILAFTFFYSSISFNPAEMSKNIQQNGGMIPGIRQGKPTTDFIAKINHRITLFGAFFLAILALLPVHRVRHRQGEPALRGVFPVDRGQRGC